jgi:CoA:oxalate CoA-transferase
MNLLQDILVLDFSQFLSGPSAGLRLADLGARVIKIEKPGTGDMCRTLYVSDAEVDGQSTIFHAINRNKESFTADLKDENDVKKITRLIKSADVLIHNFRPGVMKRLGLCYEDVKAINERIIYAEISGYGEEGEWKSRPGQDLLLQAVSGITHLSGNENDNPVPMGVAAADILAGTHLVQGILAALYNNYENKGALVQVSMLESLIDFQFEVLTCFYNDGNELPVRSSVNNAHAYLSAPYGIYQTSDGAIALAMARVNYIGELLGCEKLKGYTDPLEWFSKRDEIKNIIKHHLLQNTNSYWLAILEPMDIWCAPVFNYDELMQQEGYRVLEMEQEAATESGWLKTTRCPIRVDGKIITSVKGAPVLGGHTTFITEEFGL